MQDFQRIEAWQLSRTLVAVYTVTRGFPLDERYGLTRQVRRSVTAIGASIAEAFGRATRTDCARVLQNAISEGNETLHHLTTAHDLGYLSDEDLHELTAQRRGAIEVLQPLDAVTPASGLRRFSASAASGSFPQPRAAAVVRTRQRAAVVRCRGSRTNGQDEYHQKERQ